MPAKFIVQWKNTAVIYDEDLGLIIRDVWLDTAWKSLSSARNQWPNNEYREVMLEW